MFSKNNILKNLLEMGKSTEKLSSGLRINGAADDAAGLSISQKMRSQIRGLVQANRNIQDGIALVQVAEAGLSEVGSKLQRMRELSVQGANDTLTNKDRQTLQQEIEQLKKGITGIVSGTKFNTISLLDVVGGTTSGIGTENLVSPSFSSTNSSVATIGTLFNTGDWSHDIVVNQIADTMEVRSQSFTSLTASLGLSGDFDISGTLISISDSDSVTTIRDKINGSGAGVMATIDGNQLVITSSIEGANGAFTLTDHTIPSNTFSSTNPAVVDPITLLSNTEWSQDVNVSQLATAHQATSETQTDVNAALNLKGSFDINGAMITVEGSDSLTSIKDKINGANAGVVASIISNKLVITSTGTGVANAFTAQDLTSDGFTFSSSNSGVAITDTLLSNTEWSHVVDVTQLAGTHEVRSTAVTDINASLGLSGKFSISGVQITVIDSDSLASIRDKINASGTGIQASIDSNNQLHLRSTVSGALGVFTSSDDTTNSNTLSSSNTSVATTGTLLNNTEWAHNIEVVQLAGGTSTTVTDDFSTDKLATDYTVITGTWSVTGGILRQTNRNGENYALSINGTSSQPASRTLEIDVLRGSNNAQVGGYLSYADANNFTRFYIAKDGIGLVLEKKVNGVSTTSSQNTAAFTTNTFFNLKATTDGTGKYTIEARATNGTLLATVNVTNWTDAPTIGSMRLYTEFGPGDFDNLKTSSSSSSGTTQEAIYRVNGVEYRSTSNTVTIKDGTTDYATINLTGIGNTTVSHKIDNAILQTLNILNSTGTYANIIEQGQDALYSVDGVSKSSSTNQNILLENSSTGVDHATIDLVGVGGTTVSNKITNDVLHDLGILSSGSLKNVTQQAQNAEYTVNGTSYSSNINSVTLRDGEGISLAQVQFKAVGMATVSNTADNPILEAIQVLDSSGNYVNQTGVAQDASYSVDGANYTSDSNTVTIAGDASIHLVGAGSTTVSNSTSTTSPTTPTNNGQLLIQSGSNSNQVFKIMLTNATVQTLGLTNLTVETRDDAGTSIAKVNDAINAISAERSKYGSYQNALEHVNKNVMNYTENLIAAESRIVDVDMAKELINLTKRKILLQASTSMLAQANQNADSVIKLISG
jgi:flagellin-like hook-associated protein FlgL